MLKIWILLCLTHLNWVTHLLFCWGTLVSCIYCSSSHETKQVLVGHVRGQKNLMPGLCLIFESYIEVVRCHPELTKGSMTSKITSFSEKHSWMSFIFTFQFLCFHFSISFPMWWWAVCVEALKRMSLDRDEWRERQLQPQRKDSLLLFLICSVFLHL